MAEAGLLIVGGSDGQEGGLSSWISHTLGSVTTYFRESFQWRWVVIAGVVVFCGGAVISKKMNTKKKKEKMNQTVHRGIICSNCGDVIKGIRYMCANCT